MRRRGIVVVHGVGSQKKGETLKDIAEPIARYLRHYLNPNDPHVLQLNVDMRPGSGPARAEIRFNHAGDTELWTITEAWWAESFYPGQSDAVLAWGWNILRDQAQNIFFGTLGRHIPFRNPRTYPPGAYPYGSVPDRGKPSRIWSRIYDFFLSAALLLFFGIAYGLALILATIFFLVAQLPPWLLVPAWAARLQQWLLDTLLYGPGDEYVLSKDNLARASAWRTVLEGVGPYLNPDHPDYAYCDGVSIIAHSGGCLAAYFALSDLEVKGWSFGEEEERPRTTVTWFSVGSGLNVAFRERKDDPLWDRKLDPRIKWVDIWARHDPVPHGETDHALKRRIRELDDYKDVALFVSQRVVNRDNPFTDHGEYWRNYEEVVSRFVYETLAGPGDATPLGAGVRESIKEIPLHRGAVARKFVAARVVAAVVGIAGFFAGRELRLGDDLLRFLQAASLPWPVDKILEWLGGNPTLGIIDLDVLAGIVLLASLAYFAYRLYTLWFQGWLERGEDWGD